MSDIKRIIDEIIAFRDARDWKQFHTAKDLAIALSVEAAELNELFLWKDETQISAIDEQKVADELADVIICALMLAEKYQFDVEKICLQKIVKNAQKYPIDKVKGCAKKYTEYLSADDSEQ